MTQTEWRWLLRHGWAERKPGDTPAEFERSFAVAPQHLGQVWSEILVATLRRDVLPNDVTRWAGMLRYYKSTVAREVVLFDHIEHTAFPMARTLTSEMERYEGMMRLGWRHA